MELQKNQALGLELFRALRSRTTLAPLTEREPDITIDDAYHISRHFVALREQEGERIIGKKIGVTSLAVQSMLGVFQPDFGFLTDAMKYPNGAKIPASTLLIQPRAEGEIAFLLKHDLVGPGVTPEAVLEATEGVIPCFEIVDSRIKDWKIKIQDTIADNASCGVVVLGEDMVDPKGLDLAEAVLTWEKNGVALPSGKGSAVQGSPLIAVAWLANTLGQFGIPLKAGEIILSGSLVPLIPVAPGDTMTLQINGIGKASVSFI